MIHILLKDKKVVLASASPRRKQILSMLGITFLQIPSGVSEPTSKAPAWRQVITHASNKARAVAINMDQGVVVIAADTSVVIQNAILGKPNNIDEASYYLNQLSGKSHTVYTGICACWQNRIVTGYEKSIVRFKELSHEEIENYLQTNEPLDKAGAYGIQGFGSQFIERVVGCYYNVMGLPVNLLYRLLQNLFNEDKS